MITETFSKTLKMFVELKKSWGSKLNPQKLKIFSLMTSLKNAIENFSISPKNCPVIGTPTKDELISLGSPLGPKTQADLLERQFIELEKVDGILKKWMLIIFFVS